ncbi:hypothetical protein BDN72DRAFT_674101 [Pluteus cervinus]|uniref:Uncharacterized protein n=1 Tax=Pluteus cervinus TaxID=181527 RepID=A0ACD3AS09_9AGAR|nr:hypothetical protein BDN72DRAFT_674101 [Pluteus cervinus]
MVLIPTDIILHIVELVPKGDVGTLKSLSLTSPLLRDICQKRLFKSISLENSVMVKYDSRIPPPFLVNFHKIVTQSPRIASYIQRLKIAQHSISPSGGMRYRRPGMSMVWMIDHSELISEAFDAWKSPRIHTLNFYSRRIISWTELDERFRNSLFRILQNPAFNTIITEGLRLPGHFFAGFPSLRSVALYHPYFSPGAPGMSSSTRKHQISHLTFHVHYDANFQSLNTGPSPVDCVGPAIGLDLRSLRTLDLEMNFSLTPQLQHLFQLPKLWRLRVSTSPFEKDSVDIDPGIPPPTINLSRLSNLTGLTLRNLDFGITSASFSWVVNALESLTTSQIGRLERFTLSLATTSDIMKNIQSHLDVIMQQLGQYLSSFHRRAEQLRSIRVDMKVAWGENDQVLQINEWLLSQLSWSGCEGILDVRVEQDEAFVYRNRGW